jgi:hypothetical protein
MLARSQSIWGARGKTEQEKGGGGGGGGAKTKTKTRGGRGSRAGGSTASGTSAGETTSGGEGVESGGRYTDGDDDAEELDGEFSARRSIDRAERRRRGSLDTVAASFAVRPLPTRPVRSRGARRFSRTFFPRRSSLFPRAASLSTNKTKHSFVSFDR